MSFALCCTLLGILVFSPETETAGARLSSEPSNPSYAVVGQDFTLEWNYSVDGTLNSVQFSNGTGSRKDPIAIGFSPGKINSTQKYEARFKAEATITRAELRILAVQLSDEATYQFDLLSKNPIGTITDDVKVIVRSPPSNIVTSSDQTITAPAELNLKCSAVGKPTPSETWTRLSDNTNVSMPLNITGGKNEERYRCTTYNGVGIPLSKVVKITIHFHPMVALDSKVFVGREETASLNCKVEGNPPATISWSPCDEGNPPCSDQYLNISKVQSARTNYTCTAKNYLGTDSATTVLLIGGKNIYLRLSVSGECDTNVSVWETLEKELAKVFANATQNYSEAELLDISCASLIFDVALKFTTEVAEDDTISIIRNAIVDGKLGELSVNVSYIIGIPRFPQTTITAPTSAAPKSDDNNTGLIIGAVLGGVAFVALIFLIVWCVRKKKCFGETKEVSDKNADAGRGRKGKGPNGADEVAYASTSMLPNSKRPVEKTNQSTVQALPMYAQVDKTKKTSNKGGAAQRQRQPGELQYAEVEHVTSGKSLPRKSSSEPIKPSNEEIVYADLV